MKYRIAGNFRGNYILLFLRIFDTPRKLNLEYLILVDQYAFRNIYVFCVALVLVGLNSPALYAPFLTATVKGSCIILIFIATS